MVFDSTDTNGPVVQLGMNAAFACPVQKKAEAAGSNPARSTIILSLNQRLVSFVPHSRHLLPNRE